MNHLIGLKIEVIGEWPSLKNFNRKENKMQYMTNQMLQRFMSHMSKTLSELQFMRQDTEDQIKFEKQLFAPKSIMEQWYRYRNRDKSSYVKNSKLQEHVKRGFIEHKTLQKMEKVVTTWIVYQQDSVQYTYQDYLENRYDPFYRNKSKQAKQKLAKLVELQQAIRKQKRITRN